MHDSVFDRYRDAKSHLHNLDARVKVLVAVAFILSNSILPDGAWLAFGLTWLAGLYLNWLSKLGISYTLQRSFIALPFAIAAVSAIFAIPGEPLATWQLGSLTLIPTDAGVLRFISIVIRSWLSVQAAILLVATTPFPDLLHALEHLHVPAILTTIIAFLYRYLFVLTDEVMRLTRARQSRSAAVAHRPGEGGQKSGRSVWWRARTAGNMTGQLFLRSYERSDRIYNAMLARGYTGQLRTLTPHIMHSRDWAYSAVAAFVILLLQLTGRF